jgi:sugar lactone lactonase YvrE
MRKCALPAVLGLLVLASSLQAVVPQKWELRTRDDYLRGKFDGVSVSYDGTLALAPKEEKIAAPQEEFYLSALATTDGATYLGTGHGGKVYRIDKTGKAELWFQAPEMDVTALAQDRKGTLFAATSPNGKVYKIMDKGKGEEFFNPAEKYIWDLLFFDSGELWAAVGESGGIYRISPLGEGGMFFKAAENHILCLERTARGDVVAGSGGNGLVYRISAEGRASVLFETPYEEVRSLALDREGQIYAAASGTPVRTKKEDASDEPVRLNSEVVLTVSAGGAVSAGSGGAGRPAALPGVAAGAKEGGALFRITPDGLAQRLWSSDDEMIYSLLWREDEKKVLFGTGGKGRIYSVDRDGRIALLLQQSSEQVYQLVPLDSKIYVLSNNPCYFGLLLPEQRFSGEYTSPVLDARTQASWGRIAWDATVAAGASVQLQSRSGNTGEPNATWTDWSPFYGKGEEPVLSPKARYLQVKVLLRTQTGKASPVFNRLSVFYLQANMAPFVTRLELLKPNEVYLKLPEQDDVILGLERNPAETPAKPDDMLRLGMPSRKAERKGYQTIAWDAADENGDTLRYTLALRKDGEPAWRTLAEDLTETIYAFDTLAYPDGTYLVRLTASDGPSNPAGLELRADKTGPPLVIDNSLPVVKGLTAARNGAALDIAFQAEDAYSYIEEAKVLVRPGEWRVVFPVDGIADSRSESFKVSLKLPAGAENQVTVRVRDSYGNVGVARLDF